MFVLECNECLDNVIVFNFNVFIIFEFLGSTKQENEDTTTSDRMYKDNTAKVYMSNTEIKLHDIVE